MLTGLIRPPASTALVPGHPARAPELVVHTPEHPAQPWTVQHGTDRYFRVGADAACLLDALDGRRTPAQLANELGAPWTPATVGQALAAFATHGWLADTDTAAPPRRQRVTYKRPLTIQLALFDPSKLLRHARPALAWLAAPYAALAALAGVLITVATLLTHLPELRRLAQHPPSAAAFTAAVLLGLFSGVLHEFGHASMLLAHGGRPRRFGVMLFYLMPALFCDVSDGWRLPHARRRVAVALAGVGTELVLAGIASLLVLFLPPGTLATALLLYLTGCMGRCVFNLMPFVKLDGYLALMSHLDISHLRDRAMTDARNALAKILFGGIYRRELPLSRWTTAFGLGCMVFPVLMLTQALLLWTYILPITGTIAALATSALFLALAVRLLIGLYRLYTRARTAGATRRRITLTTLAAATTATALLLALT
ncbi:daptide biosynthesis intramembrane metalloprotease [Streptomyces sp. NPDC086554]|uniref:daptide biosynthesis intramembrane metalloprotease n=1 Tax=Streptomyces sp. NPDC086554 TaxID=3154864 RepID=UPI003435062A